jgi:hypothetical protein
MGLYFRNNTPSPVWIVLGYHAPGCEGGVDWAKTGWYKVNPGSTAKVVSGYVGDQCWLYYAEDDFGHVWSGPYNTFVPWSAFNWCWTTASTSGKSVGFRYWCIAWYYWNYTKVLVL